MPALNFVNSLLERGIARVAELSNEPSDWLEAVRELDAAFRPEIPDEPPLLIESAAIWGLQTMYRACQFLAYRQVDAAAVQQALSLKCPVEACPSVCYSVDLALQYLPDLLVLTRGIAPADPLVLSLLDLARAWPLSSVGVADLFDLDVSMFIEHSSLRRLYVDRVIEYRDGARLQHATVRQAVLAAVGDFPELAPFLKGGRELAGHQLIEGEFGWNQIITKR